MLPSIAQLANKHGIFPLKKYGQNFIFDKSLCDKIVKFAKINRDSCVLEIGPGTAGLTRSILELEPKILNVIEKDTRCILLLKELVELYPALKIQHGDALLYKLDEICSLQPLDIVANLPYNIGSQLLVNWIGQIKYVNSMTLMLQKEVVDRIVANHSSKNYGRLSVLCQVTCNSNKCFDVSPKAFYPEPKVWSSIVRLIPRIIQPSKHIIDNLSKTTLLAFSGRRKMIKSSLRGLHNDIASILEHLNINHQNRAENLSPKDYLLIAEELSSRQ